jgi:hypothetical protein
MVRFIIFKLLRFLLPACHRNIRSSGKPGAAAWDHHSVGSDLRSAFLRPAHRDVYADVASKPSF